jgi:hypothetical protein
MKTPWGHLPNAEHIDRVLADFKDRSNAWDTAWHAAGREAVYYGARNSTYTAWHAAYDVARHASRVEVLARLETKLTAKGASMLAPSWDAAWDTMLALIAYDRAGSYLSLPVNQVKVLADLGDNIAILMLPGVIALKNNTETNFIKEKQDALQQ